MTLKSTLRQASTTNTAFQSTRLDAKVIALAMISPCLTRRLPGHVPIIVRRCAQTALS